MSGLMERMREHGRVRELERELNVRERAAFEAERGSGPVTFGELLARAYGVREEQAGRRLLKAIGAQRIAAVDSAIGAASQRFVEIARKYRGAIAAASEQAWQAKAGAALETATAEREKLRTDNLITREASYPDDRVRSAVVLAVLWSVHIIANAMCFASASQMGLLGGVMMAALLSLPDVAGGVILGFFGLRYRNHIRPEQRLLGTIVSMVCLVVLIVWTFFVAHLRAALEAEIAAGRAVELAAVPVLSHMLSAPWAIFQVTDALVLMLVSQAAAAVATYEGYHLDDAYPGYGKADRRVREAKAGIDDANSELRSELNAIIGRADTEIGQRIASLDRARSRGERLIAEVDARLADYHGELAGWQAAAHAVYATFEDVRHRQCQALGQPTPPHRPLVIESHPTEVQLTAAKAALRAQIARALDAAETATRDIVAAAAQVAADHGLGHAAGGKATAARIAASNEQESEHV